MRMRAALVHLQLGGHLATHLGLRQHAGNGLLDYAIRSPRHQAHKRFFPHAARKSGVAAIHLLLALQPGQADLLRVQHNDMITRVDVGRILRAVLAAQHPRGFRSQAPQRFAAGIQHVPLAVDVLRTRNKGRHGSSSPKQTSNKICLCEPMHTATTNKAFSCRKFCQQITQWSTVGQLHAASRGGETERRFACRQRTGRGASRLTQHCTRI